MMKFTEDHEWLRVDGDFGTVGITPFAQEKLGDLVFVELPSAGAKFEKGERHWAVLFHIIRRNDHRP